MATRLEDIQQIRAEERHLTELLPGTEHNGLRIAYGLDIGRGALLNGKQQEDNVRLYKLGLQTIAVLADGVGGHGRGDEASRTTVTVLPQQYALHKKHGLTDEAALAQAVIDTGNAVNKIESVPGRETPTSTVVAVVINQDGTGTMFRAGDSRAYCVSPTGEIKRLAKDHSYVETLIDSDLLTDEARYSHPKRNMISYAITNRDIHTNAVEPLSERDLSRVYEEPSPMPQEYFIGRFALEPEETLLLCSDGLWEMVRDPELAAIITTKETEQPTYGASFASIRFKAEGDVLKAISATPRDFTIGDDIKCFRMRLPKVAVPNVSQEEIPGIRIELSPHQEKTELRVIRHDRPIIQGRAIVFIPTERGDFEIKAVEAAGGRVMLPIGSVVLAAEDEMNISLDSQPQTISQEDLTRLVVEARSNFGLSLVEYAQQHGFIIPQTENPSFAIVEVQAKPQKPRTKAIVDRLIDAANAHGGLDNISTIILQRDEVERTAIPRRLDAPRFDPKTLRKKFLRAAYGFTAKTYKPVSSADINHQTAQLLSADITEATVVYPQGKNRIWQTSGKEVFFSGEHAKTGITRKYVLDIESFFTRALGARIAGEDVFIPFGFDGFNLSDPGKMLCLHMTKQEYRDQLQQLATKLYSIQTRRMRTTFGAMIDEAMSVLGI